MAQQHTRRGAPRKRKVAKAVKLSASTGEYNGQGNRPSKVDSETFSDGPQIALRTGELLQLPPRNQAARHKGLSFTRRFSQQEIHPYTDVKWTKAIYKKQGFEREIEAPSFWAYNDVLITADKYLFGSRAGEPEYEDSIRHPIDRIANTYTVWGWQEGYFASIADAEIFNEELKAMQINQIWAPNSPVWFNIGHYEQWRWGRPDLRERLKGGNRAYTSRATVKDGAETNIEVFETTPAQAPQASACFLTQVDDSMESILDHFLLEGRIFASGSGVGINASTLRSSVEPIQGKGRSSGPISFDRGWDRSAGAIKSGGKTRRAARMVLLFSDHPDIFQFIRAKNDQEEIGKIILKEHNTLVRLKAIALEKAQHGTPAEKLAANTVLALPEVNSIEYSAMMDDLLYGETLTHQNANHSVSLKGDFWKAYKAGDNYSTRWVTNRDTIHETFPASKLMQAMCESAWANAEPGNHNNDWINLWNPVKTDGEITTSNPCSEYLHLNDTACNLSSFNAYRFLNPDRTFDAEALEQGTRLAMICADLNIQRGGFPIAQIAENTRRYRTTGIGFTNVGGTLMALGLAYDSDPGRFVAAQLVAALTASCWKASAELGAQLGAYEAYDRTKKDLRQVLNLHEASFEQLQNLDGESALFCQGEDLPYAQGLAGIDALRALKQSFVSRNIPAETRAITDNLSRLTTSAFKVIREANSFRNSFTTLSAPTGCLVGTSLILTTKGLIRLRNLGNPNGAQWQDIEFKVQTHQGPKQATKFFVNGEAPTRTIKTCSGYEITGTPQHRLKVLNIESGELVWKHLADINDSDTLALQIGGMVGSPNYVRLPNLPKLETRLNLTTSPISMTPQLAEFIGLFLGDGSLHHRGLRIHCDPKDQDLIAHVQTTGQQLFGLKSTTSHKRGCVSITFNSKSLSAWFDACGFSKLGDPSKKGKGKTPYIPDYILETNDPQVYGSFLRGLYEADGCMRDNGAMPNLATHSKPFAQEIMSTLLALGIPSHLGQTISGLTQRPLWRIRVKNNRYLIRWNDTVGFISNRKKNNLGPSMSTAGTIDARNDYIPVPASIEKDFDIHWTKRSSLYNAAKAGRMQKQFAEKLLIAAPNSTGAKRLRKLIPFLFDKVVANEDTGIKPTYDLSVPENVTYLANGFISHNTISFPLGAYTLGTSSIEPDYSLVKIKNLAGGGMITMFNGMSLIALKNLGYSTEHIREAALEAAGLNGLLSASDDNQDSAVAHILSQIENAGPVRRALNKLLAANITPKELFQMARGYQFATDEHKLVAQGKNHMEQVPWLKSEHLPVFDCSATQGDGQRSIHILGHLRMLGAIQPFLSGASSKTCNLPYDATVDDFRDAYVASHQLGVKCIALYRADSKGISVFSTDTPEAKKFSADLIWNNLVAVQQTALSANPQPIIAKQPKRQKLRGRRQAQTIKFQIQDLKGYLTVGTYPDGTCGEIFCRVGQSGTFASGILETWCKSISVMLQYGVPLDEIMQDFRAIAFEPSGFGIMGLDGELEGSSKTISVSSIVDLIIKMLDHLFPSKTGRRLEPIQMPDPTFPFVETLTTDLAQQALELGSQPTDQGHTDLHTPPATVTINFGGALCPKCFQMSYVQDGKCKRCNNPSCGYKDGGCGE